MKIARAVFLVAVAVIIASVGGCNSKLTDRVGSSSQATKGGPPSKGGGFDASIADASPPPTCGVSVTATFYFHSSDYVDGTAHLSRPIKLVIPASIPITSGGSKNGHAQLQFKNGDSTTTCSYSLHNADSSFALDGCDDRGAAGAAESANSVLLHVQNLDHGAGTNDDSLQ